MQKQEKRLQILTPFTVKTNEIFWSTNFDKYLLNLLESAKSIERWALASCTVSSAWKSYV